MAIISVLGPFGWLSQQPDGSIESRPASSTPGAYEQFEIVGLPTPQPPIPIPIPPQPPSSSHQDFFMACVNDYNLPTWPQTEAGRDAAQQVVLALFNPSTDGRLLSAGWALTPPNANGERTKVLPPGSVWTRVGFGEGHWMWLPQ